MKTITQIRKEAREQNLNENDICICKHPRHSHTDTRGREIRCVWGDCRCKGFKNKK